MLDMLPTDDCFKFIATKISKAVNDQCPEKLITIPAKQIKRQPWITNGILRSSRKNDKLYKLCIGKPSNSPEFLKYREYRNIFNKTKRLAKKTYYSELLETHKSNISQTW